MIKVKVIFKKIYNAHHICTVAAIKHDLSVQKKQVLRRKSPAMYMLTNPGAV